MTESIIKQSVEEVVGGKPIVEVVDTVNQAVEQPADADKIKSAMAQVAVAQGDLSKQTLRDLIASHSLTPREKIPRISPEADRLLVLALKKQQRNKRRRL